MIYHLVMNVITNLNDTAEFSVFRNLLNEHPMFLQIMDNQGNAKTPEFSLVGLPPKIPKQKEVDKDLVASEDNLSVQAQNKIITIWA